MCKLVRDMERERKEFAFERQRLMDELVYMFPHSHSCIDLVLTNCGLG